MKILPLILLIMFHINNYTNSMSLEEIRNNYGKAVANKSICKSMINELNTNNINAVQQAYLGAYQSVWANHAINPIEKLSTFNKGKNNIEKAVKKNANNIEIRFLRFSIQKKSPGFLRYKNHMVQDEKFLIQHQSSITSPALKKMVTDILK